MEDVVLSSESEDHAMDGLLEPEVVMEEQEQELGLYTAPTDLPFTPTFEGFGLQELFDETPSEEQRPPIVSPEINKKKIRTMVGSSKSSPPNLLPQENECNNNKESKLEFLGKVFRADCMPVFKKPDKYGSDLSMIHEDEEKYYNDTFTELDSVKWIRLHCTICARHLGCGKTAANVARSHRKLSVLICKSCHSFYGDGDFPIDKTDHTELYCKWCGQGGDLVCCSFCPKGFCYKCIRYNFSEEYLRKVQEVPEWACFSCSQKPLWPLRGVCRSLLRLLAEPNREARDLSECCKLSEPKAKKKTTQISPALQKKPLPPLAPKSPSQKPNILLSNIHPETDLQPLRPKITPVPLVNMLPRSARPTARPAPPPLPPSPPRPPPPPPPPPRQILPNPSPRFTAGSIPDVRVDHAKGDHSLVRLRLGPNREQYLRIVIGGGCMRQPVFSGTTPLTFVQRHLQDAFRLNNRAHDRLMELKEKLEKGLFGFGPTARTSEVIAFKETLKKWRDLLSYLEQNLDTNAAALGVRLNNEDIIDLEAVETQQPRLCYGFRKAPDSCRNFVTGDSDVEIVDDEDERALEESNKANSKDREMRKRHCDQHGELEIIKEKNVKKIRINGTDHIDLSGESDHENQDPDVDPLADDRKGKEDDPTTNDSDVVCDASDQEKDYTDKSGHDKHNNKSVQYGDRDNNKENNFDLDKAEKEFDDKTADET